MTRATAASWNRSQPPESRAALDLRTTFTPQETAKLVLGHVPESMDDKWFVYFEKDWLYLHRSWTGFCIYWLRLEESSSGASVAESWVSRDAEQYRSTDLEQDRQLLSYLLHGFLLGKPAAFPAPRSR